MKVKYGLLGTAALAFALGVCNVASAASAGKYCLTLYGDCKYPPDFKYFEYVNPDAPKGGSVKLAEIGSFDNVNPFILKGVKAPGVLDNTFESLMTQSMDEPMSVYGLIAESVKVAPDNSAAEFTLRKEARWHDGTPITVDDVVFSFDTLKGKGDPSFKILYASIASVDACGKDCVAFHFSDKTNKQLPLIAAAMPIMSKAYYTAHDFEKTTLDAPMSSGPYEVESVDQGRSITYKRVKNYWGQALPANRGQYNFDHMRYDMYRDENVDLQALLSGDYDFRREYIARNWATAYNAPAVKDGRIIKREIPDLTPQGMQAFIFNTRKDKLSDRRVREAINLAFDYEWTNKTIFYGAYVRNKSFFENTEFEAKGVPEGKELALLKPLEKDLPPALLTEAFQNPLTDGSGNNRANLLKADKLLTDAGWVIKEGKRVNAKGEPLSIEFLFRQPTMERVIGPMRGNLDRLGIASSIRMVDDSQYQKRTEDFDFDIVSIWINRGLFYPGNEQVALWQSSQAAVKGGNNLAGVKNKAVDAVLDALTSAKDEQSLASAGRALDRILLWEYYMIPNWHSGSFRVAYWDKFGIPKVTPKYNLGFQAWWIKN
jgi:microcin C transport system substrate-binding protein